MNRVEKVRLIHLQLFIIEHLLHLTQEMVSFLNSSLTVCFIHFQVLRHQQESSIAISNHCNASETSQSKLSMGWGWFECGGRGLYATAVSILQGFVEMKGMFHLFADTLCYWLILFFTHSYFIYSTIWIDERWLLMSSGRCRAGEDKANL